MEDINNALLHIKAKHNGEIPYQYGSKECAKLMDSYAKEYHQAKLKLLGIADVGGSIPSETELVAETADAYCPNCEAYIVNERVTYDECCDNCGTEIEWHE